MLHYFVFLLCLSDHTDLPDRITPCFVYMPQLQSLWIHNWLKSKLDDAIKVHSIFWTYPKLSPPLDRGYENCAEVGKSYFWIKRLWIVSYLLLYLKSDYCKLFERIIVSRLTDYVEANDSHWPSDLVDHVVIFTQWMRTDVKGRCQHFLCWSILGLLIIEFGISFYSKNYYIHIWTSF